MRWADRRIRFRNILAGPACVDPATVFDPISARVAEELGYESGILPGSVASWAVLGDPDLTLLSLSELAGLAYRINRASNLPIFVDTDHGFGNALNVRRTVEELETAGAAAISVEDTLLPKPFGDEGRVQVISLEEGVGKMRAALDARQESELVVVARTRAPMATGIDDAVVRGKAYEKAGVDAVFFIGVRTREDLDKIASEMRLPLLLYTSAREVRDREYLASRGVRFLGPLSHQTFPAAVQAVYATLKSLRDGVPHDDIPNIAPADMMDRLSREREYENLEQLFLGCSPRPASSKH